MSRFRAGDVVARRKGLVMHKGVVLADGRIFHNTPLRGEHRCSTAEFAAGQRIYRVDGREPGRYEGWRGPAMERASRRYHLLTNNCEHSVTRVTRGRSESPQLRSWLAGVGVAAVTFAATRHAGAAAAGYAIGRGLVARLR